jgi:hypothetical protein
VEQMLIQSPPLHTRHGEYKRLLSRVLLKGIKFGQIEGSETGIEMEL